MPFRNMIMKQLLFLAAAAMGLAVATPAVATVSQPVAKEARIAFADRGGIRNWRVGPANTLYIQDRARRWYKAELMYRPAGMAFEWRIGFDAGPTGTFDRFSTVVIDRQRIPVQSLVRVDGPPPRA